MESNKGEDQSESTELKLKRSYETSTSRILDGSSPDIYPESIVLVDYEIPGQGFIDLVDRYLRHNPQKQDPKSKQ